MASKLSLSVLQLDSLSSHSTKYKPQQNVSVPDEGYYRNVLCAVPDEGYYRNVLCTLNLISLFLLLSLGQYLCWWTISP